MQMLTELKSNPMAILSNFGVPQNLANNPQEIIQHMMNTGKVTQEQYDAAVKQAQRMGFKF